MTNTNGGNLLTLKSFSAVSHNGPVCPTCDSPYLGQHRWSPEQILAKITRLQRLLVDAAPASAPVDRTRGCPCRPENGGNGVCGCVLSGPRITCRGA